MMRCKTNSKTAKSSIKPTTASQSGMRSNGSATYNSSRPMENTFFRIGTSRDVKNSTKNGRNRRIRTTKRSRFQTLRIPSPPSLSFRSHSPSIFVYDYLPPFVSAHEKRPLPWLVKVLNKNRPLPPQVKVSLTTSPLPTKPRARTAP